MPFIIYIKKFDLYKQNVHKHLTLRSLYCLFLNALKELNFKRKKKQRDEKKRI